MFHSAYKIRKTLIVFIYKKSFSHFGFYDEDDNVVPMRHRNIYRNDSIGLKTLENEGKLKVLTFPNVRHKEWHLNVDIINEAIIPYLD